MNEKPLTVAGTVLGIGMGGFLDGIVAHQLLQVHNMLSNRIPVNTVVNIEINMFWDGLFHTLTWIATAFGLYLLFRAGATRDVVWSGKHLFGAMLFGWGLFNFVEGIIDHYILQVHFVVQRMGQSAFDAAFVASGVLLMLIGRMLIRQPKLGASAPAVVR
jgi:uncharacterized membrane protein